MTRHQKIVQMKRSVVIIVLAFMFGCIAALFAGYNNLHQLQSFDQRRAYDVCVGANEQIKKVVDQLIRPRPPSPNAPPLEAAAAEVRERRVASQREEIDLIIQETRNECRGLLSSPSNNKITATPQHTERKP